MYHPSGFSDSNNIIIKDNVPYFYYNGNSYRDKLKNGLVLDYIFDIDTSYIQITKQIEEEKKEVIKINEILDNDNNFTEDSNINYIHPLKRSKKYKFYKLKKRNDRNLKKNKIKQNGYTYKLFIIEQNLPELNFDSAIDNNQYYDVYDDYSNDGYDDYHADEEYDDYYNSDDYY